MTIQQSREQMYTAETVQPRMNIQQEIQKGLQENDKKVGEAIAGATANKQILASSNIKPEQTLQQTAAAQVSKGYLDIKV